MRRALLAALALVVAVSGQGYGGVDRSAESGRKRAENQAVGTKKFRYRIFGATVSTDGKAGSAAVLVDLSAPGMNQWAQPICPLVASTAKGAVLAFAQARNDLALYGVAMLPLAGAAGKPCWLSSLREWKVSDPAPAALAWGNDAGVFVGRDNREITAWRLDASGQAGAPEPLLASPHPAKAHATPVMPHLGLAFDGERYLLVFEEMEVVGLAGGKVRVKGLHLPAAGKLAEGRDEKALAQGAFVIGEGKWNCLLPAACAGPKGVSLVTYADVRGPDDVKVLARIVK